MALFHVSPTRLDQREARLIARHATPTLERPLKLVTWAADGHVLLPFSAAVWLMSRSGNDQQKRAADDLATSMIIAVVLPHIVKHFVDHPPHHG